MELKEIIGIFAGLLVPIISILWFAMRSKIMNAVYEILKPRDDKALEIEKKADKNSNDIEHINSTLKDLVATIKDTNKETQDLIRANTKEVKNLIKEKDDDHKKEEKDLWKVMQTKVDKE